MKKQTHTRMRKAVHSSGRDTGTYVAAQRVTHAHAGRWLAHTHTHTHIRENAHNNGRWLAHTHT